MRFFSILLILYFFTSGLVLAEENDQVSKLKNKLAVTIDDKERVDLLIELSSATSWSDVRLSEEYATQALLLSQKINYPKGIAYAKFSLSRIFSDYEFDLAENLVIQSLEIAEEIQDSILIARIFNVLGNLKSRLSFNEDALNFYNKSLDIYLSHGQDSAAAAIYNNLGILYVKMYNDDSLAIEYYLKAAEINEKTKNYLWLAINYQNIGYDLCQIGKLQEGFSFLKRSLKIAKTNNFVRLYPWIYNNYSHYYIKSNQLDNAIEYANKALLIAMDQENKFQELDALTQLKEAHFQKEEIVKAYGYLEKTTIVKDSIVKHSRLKELDLLELRYKYEEEKKKQKLEQAVEERNNYRKEATYLIIILVAAITIFLISTLYFQQRNKIRRKTLEQKNTALEKEKLSRDLDHKKKELTTNVMYLLKKNEFISAISEKLKNAKIDTEDNDTLERIIVELDKNITGDNWAEFEVRFQEVHVNFYNRLSKQFPDLTPNELRLCAFLRLNMTSKEISDITLQSTDSLKTARYRLRKKLDLDRENNLVTFLAQI